MELISVASLTLHALAFTFTMWLGLYLIARAPNDKRLLYAGLGSIAYAESLFISALGNFSESALLINMQWSFIFAPAVFWTATLIQLLPEDLNLKVLFYRFWIYSVVPLSGLLFILNLSTPFFTDNPNFGPGIFLFGAISLLPLSLVFLVALSHFRKIQPNQPLAFIFIVILFFGLGTSALLLPLEIFPREVTVFGIGLDVFLLGLSIAYFDAFDLGESFLPDITRSFLSTSLLSLVFAGQIALVMFFLGISLPLVVLLFSSITIISVLQAFANPLQAWFDGIVFAKQSKLQRERAELRAASSAAIRNKDAGDLDTVDLETFNRLTRKALSNFSDLSRLASSPLTQLPIVHQRLTEKGKNDDTLGRSQELKQILVESVLKLKPQTGDDFGSSEEWRHYNVLFFPYIIGIKPFNQRADHSHLDVAAREALEYFRTYVPERTFYNWQKVAASIVAKDLQEQIKALAVSDADLGKPSKHF